MSSTLQQLQNILRDLHLPGDSRVRVVFQSDRRTTRKVQCELEQVDVIAGEVIIWAREER